jgi:hypothetical protein
LAKTKTADTDASLVYPTCDIHHREDTVSAIHIICNGTPNSIVKFPVGGFVLYIPVLEIGATFIPIVWVFLAVVYG